MQIIIFLALLGEFANTQVDNENNHLESFQDTKGSEEGIAESENRRTP